MKKYIKMKKENETDDIENIDININPLDTVNSEDKKSLQMSSISQMKMADRPRTGVSRGSKGHNLRFKSIDTYKHTASVERKS